MKLFNKNEKFLLMFNGKEYTVPKGEFEVSNDVLANHIKYVAKKWNYDVIEVPSESVEVIRPVEITPVPEKAKPVFGGATTESIPKKTGKNNA